MEPPSPLGIASKVKTENISKDKYFLEATN